MTQTIPAAADLGPAYTGLTIGYRILNLDETEYSAFTSTGVAETNVAGFYRVDGGVAAPDAGGYIVWGESGSDYAEGTIGPAAPTAAAIRAEVDSNSTQLAAILADTGEIGAAGAGLTALATQASVDAIDDYIDTEVAAIKAVTDNLPDGGALTTIGGNVTSILADTNELQTDWANSGRLDTILDARASQSSVDTIGGNVTSILADTGTDGVVIASGAITAAVIATNAIDADALAADAVTEMQSGLATAAALATVDTVVDAIQAKTDNLPADPADASDIAAAFVTLTTKITKYVQLLARKDAAIATDNATELTAINADGGSGSGAYDNTTDSTEALRDRGDAAWTGGSSLTAEEVRIEMDSNSTQLAAIVADTGTDGVVVASGSKSGYALSSAGVQAIWDALTSALTTSGSIGKFLLDNVDIDEITDAIDSAVAGLTGDNSITIVSAISGSAITVYRNDTWAFTASVSSITLTDYEALAFVVKKATTDTDDAALLYLRSDTGLERIGGSAAASAGDGSLTIDSASEFSVAVDIDVTNVTPGRYTWALKAYDTTPSPSEGYTLATGVFTVSDYWLRAIA